ncbi:hypothetical protein O6H91_13G053600 [Diphasiastrum complanatum]|uniref:Uncharacterized protein n=1 Tax=Diphasiastrum complanatum TaxID=34168 RepID=A0ACC2BVV0_DIPCM|nr:hypothetical protein O6H91_13G053600 [Diphasiastrum complanatum]
MAKMSRQYHIFTSAHFVSSSALVARLSAQLQTTVQDAVSSSSTSPVPKAYDYAYQLAGKMAIVILLVGFFCLLLGVFAYLIKKRCASPAIPTRLPAADRRPGQKNGGLDHELIETLPLVAYSAASLTKNCTQCTVCLTEFQEGEKTRLLPKCNHAFHPECIDMWLFSHSTCPLCRINLISESHTITINSNPLQERTRQENWERRVWI